MIVAHAARYGIQEGGFSISASAVTEEERMFPRDARQAISAYALQEADKLCVTAHDAAEKTVPCGCRLSPIRGNARYLNAVVIAAMWPYLTRK